MIIYNVTVKVDATVDAEWRSWMEQEHLLDMLNTGCFVAFSFCKLLEVDESDGCTYTIQFRCKAMSDYHRYLEEHAEKMRAHSFEKFGEKCLAFRTIMEELSSSAIK